MTHRSIPTPQRFALLCALTAFACDRDVTAPLVTKRISFAPDLDLLFVIDNSASTADKQVVFAQNFPAFIAALDAFPGGRPNVHIGVVDTTVDIGVPSYSNGTSGCPSPDPGDNGLFQNTPRIPGCTAPTDRFLVDVADGSNGRTTNYSGSLADAFSCIAEVGSTGCGFEAQLEAMKRALDGTQPANAGFVRPSAYLAVVVLTDEDDCSLDPALLDPSLEGLPAATSDFRCQPFVAYTCDTPLSATEGGTYTNCKVAKTSYLHDPHSYASFLAGIKDPSQTVVAVIGGDPTSTIQTGPLTLNGATQPLALEPSCTATINGNPAVARPGLRLAQLVGDFGDHGVFESVCQADYAGALQTIGAKLFAMMSSCLEGHIASVDRDPSTPGTQLACTVVERTQLDTPAETDTPVPACAMADANTPMSGGPRPCWWATMDATCAGPDESGFAVQVERDAPPPSGTVDDVSCAAP